MRTLERPWLEEFYSSQIEYVRRFKTVLSLWEPTRFPFGSLLQTLKHRNPWQTLDNHSDNIY
jgi:hypothetical protein